MSKISKKRIFWSPVEGEDVVGYRVYVAPETALFSYGLSFVETPETHVTAPDSFPSGTFDIDQVYNVWITAVDDVGNESDPLALISPFDFVAPSSPSSGGISDL